MEKQLHFEGVLYFVIWWLQNISRVFNFAISVKIRNESLIEYQFLLSLINEIVIKYVKESLISLLQIETCDIPVSISYFDQILWKRGRYLILSWRRPLSYRNQSIDLLRTSVDWILYDNGLRHERVNISNSARYLISRVFNFRVFWFWNFSRVQNFAKMVKNCEI